MKHHKQDWQWAFIAVGAGILWVSMFVQAMYSVGLLSR